MIPREVLNEIRKILKQALAVPTQKSVMRGIEQMRALRKEHVGSEEIISEIMCNTEILANCLSISDESVFIDENKE